MDTAKPTTSVSPRRSIASRWRTILVVWTIGSAIVGYTAYRELPPIYRAMSLLRVQSDPAELYNPSPSKPDALVSVMTTQVALLTTPNVLSSALANPKVALLPRVRESADPLADLRQIIRVSILPNTTLIEVTASLPSPTDAATIVNATVEAYMESTGEWSEGMARTQIRNLEVYMTDLEHQLNQIDGCWKELLNRNAGPKRGESAEERKLADRRAENEVARLDARSRLDALTQLVAEKKVNSSFADGQEADLQFKLRAADLLETALAARLEKFNTLESATPAIEAELASIQDHRRSLVEMIDKVTRRLEQLRFNAKGEAMVRLVSTAQASGQPIRQSLPMAYLAAILVGMLGLSVGVVSLSGLLGGRRRPIETAFGLG